MDLIVSKSQFKAKALHYFRQVEKTGKSIVVTDRGEPVLKIVPYSEEPGDYLKELRNSVLKYDDPIEPVAIDDWESLK